MSILSAEIWMVVGIVSIIIEFSTIPGIGFLFLGLGSLTASVVLYYYPQPVSYQIAIVGLASLAWFLLLWRPLKNLIYKKRKGLADRDYFDLIGNEVVVLSQEIEKGHMGQVSWSGTVMNARLAVGEEQAARKGEALYILETKGNVLICSRIKP